MIEPYYQDESCVIYHGDCRQIEPSLQYDQIVTDPPYGINYRQTITGARHYEDIQGDDTDALATWAVNLKRPRIVFGANHFPSALPEPGRWICWDKRCNENADRMLGSPFELAWISGPHKAAVMYRVQHGGVVNADKANEQRHHPTQKPVVLMRRIITDLVGAGVLLDPFMGSGTTLRAAKDLGRKAIGIEISEEYCEIAAKRLAQEVLPL